jgi:hypothetical protein
MKPKKVILIKLKEGTEKSNYIITVNDHKPLTVIDQFKEILLVNGFLKQKEMIQQE